MQSTRSRKRQRTTIDVAWTRDGIQNVYDQYGGEYNIKSNTKNPGKAPALKNHFEPFRSLRLDEICSCLDAMRRSKYQKKFSMSFDRYHCDDESERDRMSLEELRATQTRCLQLSRQYKTAQQSLREQTESIAQYRRRIARLQNELIAQRDEAKMQLKRVQLQCKECLAEQRVKFEATMQSLRMDLRTQEQESQRTQIQIEKENTEKKRIYQQLEKERRQNGTQHEEIQKMRKELSM